MIIKDISILFKEMKFFSKENNRLFMMKRSDGFITRYFIYAVGEEYEIRINSKVYNSVIEIFRANPKAKIDGVLYFRINKLIPTIRQIKLNKIVSHDTLTK